MEAHQVAALALALFACALLLAAGWMLRRIGSAQRSTRTLADALERHAAAAGASADAATATTDAADASNSAQAPAARAAGSGGQAAPRRPPAQAPMHPLRRAVERAARAGTRWLDTPLGRQIVANEDRRLLEQCGYVDARARGLFLFARLACAVVLPLVACALANGHVAGLRYGTLAFAGVIAGFMLPKIFVRRWAASRRRAVVSELPMLVDLLRLLQGVGLSLDQSLQVAINDFCGMLPVLTRELEIAQRQFAAGRTREQSLQRLASSFDNEDLRAIVRLLIQVDRHGGAVQEPLKQFGDRLREGRRSSLREQIGQLTVKMTGVMIITLLPALLIVTAGPGVLAVLHSLSTHR
ncbi:MAG TPA: type II secretion system F family protein [Paraburkholderia sp.]